MNATESKNVKFIVGGLIVLLVAAVAYGMMTMPDRRTPGEKVGDAISKLGDGVDDAARELESRTPAERLSDEVRDATDGSPQ